MVTSVRWEVRRMLRRTHTNRVRHTALSDPFSEDELVLQIGLPPMVANVKGRAPADLELSADVRTIFVGRTVV